jgi:hypothetical protein
LPFPRDPANPEAISGMASLTFQVLDGLEAGRVYRDLETPLTIGREEDCHIRLNDDRVSRLHARVQEDAGRVILTDVDSTNGTRVNGHTVKMRVLHPGDQIVIGRCTLIFGSPEEINLPGASATMSVDDDEDGTDLPDGHSTPFPAPTPPELPVALSPLQTAQVSDILNYVRAQLSQILDSGQEQKPLIDKTQLRIVVPGADWHLLQKVQMDLSVYLRDLADPKK